jgi:hypothetical protein
MKAASIQHAEGHALASRIGRHSLDRGLFLYVRPDGASWVFRYTSPVKQKRREMGLGAYAGTNDEQFAVELEQVRGLAHSASMAVRAGRCPVEERRGQQEARKVQVIRSKGLTVLRLMRRWCDANAPRWSKKYANDVARMIENDPPKWLQEIPAIDLTSEDVLRALEEMGQRLRGGRVDLARQRLSWALEWMIEGGHIAANAAGILRIVRGRFSDPATLASNNLEPVSP